MGSSYWWLVAVRLALVTTIGLLIGVLFHHPAAGAAMALVGLALGDYRTLRRVQRWVQVDSLEVAPDAGGAWGDILGAIARLQRGKQYHKRRLLRLLRELRRSTTAIPDGVVVLNPQAEIFWFNRMAARLLNLRVRSDVGLRIENLVRAPEFSRYLRQADYSSPVILRASAGSGQYLQVQIVPYGAGQLLMLIRDVTRQEQLEAMRKDFVANASHELRSPLTVIAGYLETFSVDPAIDPSLRGPIVEMRRQSARMTGIIEDLLTLSRLEAATGTVSGEPIDVAPLLEQLRRDVLAHSGTALDIKLQIDSAYALSGDEAQIHSAFANLLDNAAKYTGTEGTITVRWWDDGEGGHFAVQDTGIGIAAEHIPRLTERFYRVDSGRSRATGGSGLGLAIVKHVMQRHDGRLEIYSEEGYGSVFTCHFPATRLLRADGS